MSNPTFVVRTGAPPMLFTPKNGNTDKFLQYNKPDSVKKASFVHRVRQHRWFKFFAFVLVLALAVPAFLLTGGGLFGKTSSSTPAANAGAFDFLDPSCKLFGDPIEAFSSLSDQEREELLRGTKVDKLKGSFEDGQGVDTQSSMNLQNKTDVDAAPAKSTVPLPAKPERPSYTALGTSFGWSLFNIKALGGTCGMTSVVNKSMNTVVNIALSIYAMFASFALTVFGWAMNLDLFNMFKNAIVEVIHNLERTLYLEYLTPLIIFAALWIGWNGIVKRRNSQVTQGTIWLVLAVSLTFVFFRFPATLIVGSNSLIQGISLQLMMTVAGAGNKTNDGQSICKNSLLSQAMVDESKAAKENGPNAGKTIGDYKASQRETALAAQCLMWEAFYYQPWAIGQFGDFKELTLVPPQEQELAHWNSPDVSGGIGDGLKAEDYNHWTSEAMKTPYPNGAPPLSMPELFLMSTHYTQKESEAIHDNKDNYYLINPNTKYYIDMEKRNQRRDLMVWMTCGYAKGKDAPWYNCPYYPIYTYFAGDKAGTQIGYVFLGFVSLLFAFTPLLIMAITLIFYSLTGIVLWMVLPFFLLLGVHPGFGRKLLLGWCEQIVSNALKRVGLALMMGITLLLIEIALNITDLNIIAKAFMICIIGVGVLLFRGKFVKMMSQVNFGGGGNPDAMGHELKRSGQRAAGRVAYTGGHSAGKFQNVREAGGGVGAAALAGLGGLVVGAGRSAGMRHGGTNPLRAGSYGHGQSRKGKHAQKKNQKYARGQMEDIVNRYNKAETDEEREEILQKRLNPFVKRMKKHNLPIPRVAGMEDVVEAGKLNGWFDEKDLESEGVKVPRNAETGESEGGGSDSDSDSGGGAGGDGVDGRKEAEIGAGTGSGINIVIHNDMQPLVDEIAENTNVTQSAADRTLAGLSDVEQTTRDGANSVENEVRNMSDRTVSGLQKVTDSTINLNDAVAFSSINDGSSRETSINENKLVNAVKQGAKQGAEEGTTRGAERGAETGARRGVQNFQPPPSK